MKSQKLLSDGTVVANPKETQNGSSKDYQAKDDLENINEKNIEKSLNDYLEHIFNNEQKNNQHSNNEQGNNQHSNNDLEELKVDTKNNSNFSDKNDQKNSSNNPNVQNKDEHNDNQSHEIR